MATAKGVRQVNENVIQEGRALVITDNAVANWPQTKPDKFQLLPDGALYINPSTGVMKIKVQGETDWIPAGIKNDGTIVISRDTALEEMLITITSIDNGNNTFSYKVLYSGVTTAQNRTKEKTDDGYVFEFENGMCFPNRYHFTVTLNGTTEYSVTNGDMEEVDGTRFIFKRTLKKNDKLLVRYIKWVKIGNPYPRFFLNASEPSGAQIGDFWLDLDGTITNHTDIVSPIIKYRTENGWTTLYNTLLSKVLRKDRYFSEFSTQADRNNVINNLKLDNRYFNINNNFSEINSKTDSNGNLVAKSTSELNSSLNSVIANLKLNDRYLQKALALGDLTDAQKEQAIANLKLDQRYDAKYLEIDQKLKEIKDLGTSAQETARSNIGLSEILAATVTSLWNDSNV